MIRPARRSALTAMAALLAHALAGWTGAGAAEPAAAAPVRGFYDALLHTMQDGHKLGQNGRYAALEPVVERSFDIPYMTRMAVGPAWSSLDAAKRQKSPRHSGAT